MQRQTENKIVLVVRETRLEDLKARFNTAAQARFYVEQMGGDFSDYEAEDRLYRAAVATAQQALSTCGRVQVLRRAFVSNFIFGPSDTVVAVGQDGLVANTLKYLEGQPLIGVNPDPARYDGVLLPFQVRDLAKLLPEVFRGRRPLRQITMARVTLNNGQTLHAVNDLFIGPKSHGSARYTIKHGDISEKHSSSGVIVSTGLGSTGWLASLVAGALGISQGLGCGGAKTKVKSAGQSLRLDWDSDELVFTVREPFPSKATSTQLVFGRIGPSAPLELESHMPERGVIFSDGMENDFLDFNSGTRAVVTLAEKKCTLVV